MGIQGIRVTCHSQARPFRVVYQNPSDGPCFFFFPSFQSRLSCCHTVDVHIYIHICCDGEGGIRLVHILPTCLALKPFIVRQTILWDVSTHVCCTYANLLPLQPGGPSLIHSGKDTDAETLGGTNVKGRPAKKERFAPQTSVRMDTKRTKQFGFFFF